MSVDPLFWMLAVAAVLIAGVSKGGFGGGIGVVAVPLMALTTNVPTAAAIMLPILCLMDVMNMTAYWGKWDRRVLKILVPASFVGIAIGALTFRFMSEEVLRLLIGLIALGFTLNHWLKRAPADGRKPGDWNGRFWGAMAGFTSFAAHAGGPPIAVYLLPQKLHKTTYQATTVFFFICVNYVKLVPYIWLGQLNSTNLTTSALLAPLAFIGVWAGIRLHKMIPEQLFYRVAYILLFVTGLKLIWDGASGLIYT